MENSFPTDLKYNQDYSWVKIEDDVAVLGVIDKAAKQVEEFVFVMLPEVGKRIIKDEVYLNLEAIKWSGHLTSPISGEVIEVNMDVFNEPSKINENSYQNWLVKVKITDKSELEQLIDADQAKEFYQKK